jgi:hypothetical protein
MSFRRCKGTAISALPQSHYWGILHTNNMVLTQKSLAEAVICQRFLFKMNAITASG